MKSDNKVKRLLSTISIIGIFVIVAVLVFGALQIIKLNKLIVVVLGVLAIICVGLIFALPWVEKFDNKLRRIFSIVFLSIISVCVVLWIISWILTMRLIGGQLEISPGIFNLIKFTLILTIQFLAASTICSIVLRYKNTMIAFQVITYISYLYIDFWFTFLLACLVDREGNNLDFLGKNSIIYTQPIFWALLILSFIYIFISSTVIKVNIRRKMNSSTIETNESKDQESPNDRLKKLKDMLDNNLITQEEYESKKQEILKDI